MERQYDCKKKFPSTTILNQSAGTTPTSPEKQTVTDLKTKTNKKWHMTRGQSK